jgi:type I restriction enzyme S subunit
MEGSERRGERLAEAYPFTASPVLPNEPIRPGWRWVRLSEVARLATGHTPSRRCPEYWDGDIPWLQLPDIRALDGRRVHDTSEHTNTLGIENSAAVLLPEGTVCLSRTASVGFVTVMGRPMATSQDFVNWVCVRDLHPHFLMWLFIACRGPIRELGSGAVHHTIYFPTVEAFAVCIPPLAEQERIAQRLTEQLTVVERARDAAAARLAAAEALPAAYLREVFEREGASEWETRTIGQLRTSRVLLEHQDGNHGELHPRQADFVAHGVRFATAKYIQPGGKLDLNGAPCISSEQAAGLRIGFARAGDVLLAHNASVGPVGIAPNDCAPFIVGTSLTIFRPDPTLMSAGFLLLALKADTFQRQLTAAMKQTTRNQVPITQQRELLLPLPPLMEQHRIAADLSYRLAEVECLKQAIRAELAAIDALPATLLREAFGGDRNPDNGGDP